MPFYKKLYFRYLMLFAIIVLGCCYWLKFYAQDFFLFAPDKIQYDSPKRKKLVFEDVYFSSKDGTKLHGWFIPAKNQNPLNAKATVIQFHGNSQNISSNWQLVEWLPQNNYNVFVFDYRGYGKSEGFATLDGVYEDGVSALNYLKSRKDIDNNKIFVFGQSLGASIALYALNNNKSGIKGVTIEGGFYSYEQISKDLYKYISYFANGKYSPNKYIDKVSPTPIMIMHGIDDEIIKYYHGKMLYEKAKQPKIFVPVKGGHIQAFFLPSGDTYQKIMLKFFEDCLNN